MTKLARIVSIGLTAAAMMACKGKKQDTTPKNTGSDAAKIDPTLCDPERRRVVTFDLNKDGKHDVWRLYIGEGAGEYMSCKHVDFDHDGRKDWIVAYDAQGATLYQKADFDYDGKFDMTAVFEGNHAAEVERDTDFDGQMDIKEIYDGSGQLTSVRRDRNGDNRPDQWENYTGATLASVSYDDDFDGKVDRRDDAPAGTPAPAPAPTPEPTPPPAPPATGTPPADAPK